MRVMSTEQRLKYASGYHAPVLCNTVIQGLVTNPNGTYVDGTLGGGGHTAAMLDVLSDQGRVIAIDQDDEAIREARLRLPEAVSSGKLQIVKGNFANMAALLAGIETDQVDGILLDLGVSSHQLDAAERGFSHRMKGPLDMRMDQTQTLDADQIVNTWDEGDIRSIFFRYGEEPKSSRISRAVVTARPITSTEQLADLVRKSAPRNAEAKTLARIFQALRIAVNEELQVLDTALEATVDLVKPGGRIAIISYHSLEDRRAKRFLKSGNLDGKMEKDFFGNLITPWKEITRKPISADETEMAQNPRSRSARLRIAERLNNEKTN